MKPNFGNANMGNIMKQAQKLQQEMKKAQEQLEQKSFTAKSGGGAVSVTISGKHHVTELAINPDVIDADDVEMLQDLIMVAVNDALGQIDAETAAVPGNFSGGMF
ncbi:MAG: YbaB/EbfC family nucleoid-associated protein [Clostridiales bacterium]|jgi:DNA-binding YbaB/EbfC family protein|nr:YbaB/EbfC family nucleoid-associated protein [Clostridiales bacterium]